MAIRFSKDSTTSNAAMAEKQLADKIQQLNDLELALLSCLITEQHCIIRAARGGIDALSEDLGKISGGVFGLSHIAVDCTEDTDLEAFGDGLFVDPRYTTPKAARQSASGETEEHEGSRLANVVIVNGLNLASDEVQIQALELIRSRRVFARGSFHSAPKRFVLVILLPSGDDAGHPPLNSHLTGQILLSHLHTTAEGSAPHARTGGDTPSVVVRKRPPTDSTPFVAISSEDIDRLTSQSQTATLGMDVRRYLYDVVVCLRMHRAVERGISPKATKHLELLARCLAALHGLSYVTPSLVALAAKKVYPHRIAITEPQNERSMQWGSDLAAVATALKDVTPESVIDEVLATVDVPV